MERKEYVMRKLQTKREVNKLAVLFTLAYMVSYITRINFGAVISEIEIATQMPKSLLSIVLTGSFVSYGLGQIVSGICGDIFSPKKLISCGFVITIVMNLLIPLYQNHVYMLIVWSLNGFAQAFMWPPMVKMMTELLTPDDYKKTTAKVSWGSALGTIFIYLLSPFLISVFGWKSVFVFSAVCGIVMLIFWNKYSLNISVLPANGDDIQQGEKQNAHFFSPLIIGVMAAIFLQGMLRDGVTTWMPSYIAETYHISNAVSILSGVLLPIFGVICLQAAARLYRTKFENPLACAGVCFGVGMIAAFLLLIVTGKNAALSVFSAAVLTGSMHAVNLMLISMLPPFFQKFGRVSTASGILNSCTYAGSAASTYIIAYFAEKYGWLMNAQIWLLVAFSGTVLCFCCVRGWRRKYM